MPTKEQEQRFRERYRMEQQLPATPDLTEHTMSLIGDLVAAASASARSGGLPSPIPPQVSEFVGETVKKAAIPGALGAVGAGLGAMTGPFAPVAIPTFAGGLSAGGEYINQALGVTPRSRTQIAIAGLLPPALSATGALINAGVRRSSAAAPELMNIAREKVPGLVAKLKVSSQTIDDLYAAAQATSPGIPLKSFQQAVQKVRAQYLVRKPSLQDPKFVALLDDMKTLADSGLTYPAEINATIKGFREFRRNLAGEPLGGIKAMYGGLLDDLEAAARVSYPKSPGLNAEMLKAAISATRRDVASDALEDMLRAVTRNPRKGATAILEQFNQPKGKVSEAFMNAVKKGDISRKEYQEIKDALKTMTAIKVLPPGKGQQFGAGGFFGRLGSVGGLLALLGVDATTSGAIGGMAGSAPYVFSRALMTDSGRRYIRAIAEGGHYWGPQQLTMLGNIVRAAMPPGGDIRPQSLPPPITQEVQLPPVYDIAPPINPSQLPRSPG